MPEHRETPREFVPDQNLINELWRVRDPESRGDTNATKVLEEFFIALLDFSGIPKKRIAFRKGTWQSHRVWLVEPPADGERKIGQVPGKEFIDFEIELSDVYSSSTIGVKVKIAFAESYEMPDWAKRIAKKYVLTPDKKYTEKIRAKIDARRRAAEEQAERRSVEKHKLLMAIFGKVGFEQKIAAEQSALFRRYVKEFCYEDDTKGFEIMFLDRDENILVKIFKNGEINDILEFSKPK